MKRINNLYLVETEDEKIVYVTGSGASGGQGSSATAPTITVT